MGKKQQKDKHGSGRPKGAQIKCLKCNSDNLPDRMFCANCGAKLPLAKDPFADAPRPSRIKPILKQIPRLLALLIVIAVAMCLWPASYIGMEGDQRNAINFEEKIEKLHAAIGGGQERTIVINEAGINAFLKQKVDQHIEKNQYADGTVLKGVRMMIEPESLRVQVKSDHGPLPLTREVEGVPRVEGNNFVFDVETVTVGILPLPSPLSSVMAKRIGRVFSSMQERDIIDSLRRIETGEGKVRLTVGDEGN